MLFNLDQELAIGKSKVFDTEIVHSKGSDMIKIIAKKTISISPQIKFKSHIGMIFNSTDHRSMNFYKPMFKRDLSMSIEFYPFRAVKSWSAVCLILDNKSFDDKITIRKGSTICYLVPIDSILNYEEVFI